MPRGTKIRLVHKRTYTATTDTTLGAVAEEMLGSQAKAVALMKCNRQELLPYVKVAKGESVRLPDYRMYSVGEDTTLGSLAEKVLGSSDAAAKLLERNPSWSSRQVARRFCQADTGEGSAAGPKLKLPGARGRLRNGHSLSWYSSWRAWAADSCSRPLRKRRGNEAGSVYGNGPSFRGGGNVALEKNFAAAKIGLCRGNEKSVLRQVRVCSTSTVRRPV